MIDYTAWQFWINTGNTAVTLAIGLYLWWDKRRVKTAERFGNLETWRTEVTPVIDQMKQSQKERKLRCARHREQLDQLDKEQVELRSEIKHLPGKTELAELSGQIVNLTEKLGNVDGRLTGINRAVDLLNQHHLRINE